jgi:hypothetical protein
MQNVKPVSTWWKVVYVYSYMYLYVGFKTFFYVVRHLDSIVSYLPTGLHVGFFRAWPSLFLPSSFTSVFLVLSFLFGIHFSVIQLHISEITRRIRRLWTSDRKGLCCIKSLKQPTSQCSTCRWPACISLCLPCTSRREFPSLLRLERKENDFVLWQLRKLPGRVTHFQYEITGSVFKRVHYCFFCRVMQLPVLSFKIM